MVARSNLRIDWRFFCLTLQSLIVAAVGIWSTLEFSQYAEGLRADDQPQAEVDQAPTHSWAGSG